MFPTTTSGEREKKGQKMGRRPVSGGARLTIAHYVQQAVFLAMSIFSSQVRLG